MRILLTGAGGQLAYDLKRALAGHEVAAFTHAELDVRDTPAVRRAIEGRRPDVFINTAAFHRVDDCETQVEPAFETNGLAVRRLSEACADHDVALVHISTDYVFGGQSKREPLVEDDRPQPTCVYGVSKLAGEALVRCTWPKHYIIRTCGLYGFAGASGKGGNFVQTMLRKARAGDSIKVVDDQTCTPTYTRHLADKLAWLVTTEAFGLYHITSAGSCTWYEFARAIFDLAGLSPDLAPTTTAASGAAAKRPPYSVLDNGGLAALGADDLPSWQDALRAYLSEKGELN